MINDKNKFNIFVSSFYFSVNFDILIFLRFLKENFLFFFSFLFFSFCFPFKIWFVSQEISPGNLAVGVGRMKYCYELKKCFKRNDIME